MGVEDMTIVEVNKKLVKVLYLDLKKNNGKYCRF